MVRTWYCEPVKACTSQYVTRVFKDPKKVCLNCKHYKPKLSFQDELCVHPTSTSIDIVNGSIYFEKAQEMRMDNKNKCGLDARFFEQESKINIMIKYFHIDSLLMDCMKAFIFGFIVTCIVMYINVKVTGTPI